VRIHHGLELDRYEPAPPPPRDGELIAGALARLIPGKGLATLIEALGRLGPNPGVRLRIGGEGPDRDRLERLAAALPAGARVELVGPVHDPPAFWRGCHVGVAPSDGWIESFGLSPLEAMAVGRPVIVSRAGGLPEVVGDGTGILVEPGDAGQLAAALARYRDDPELAAAHGGAGRERCERAFSMERCAAEYAELFRRLCPRPGRMLVPAGWRGARPFDLAPLAPDTETVEA